MTHPFASSTDATQLDAAVLRCLGLREQPFAPRATERFVYGDPALDMAVGVLLQRLETEDKPQILLGEKGVGKSTQLTQLLSRGAAALTFCAFRMRTGATFAGIEHAIRQQWGHSASGPDEDAVAGESAGTNSLAMILLSVVRGRRRPVLVIDDAHLLEPAVLGVLLRLRREVNRHGDSRLGIVLAGEPGLHELAASAHSPEIPAETFGVTRLRPFLESQTDAYLRHRLQAAGAADPGLLSGETAKAIQGESDGLPIEINRVANRFLRNRAAETSSSGADRPPDTRLPGTSRTDLSWGVPVAAGAMGLLMGVLIASLFFVSHHRSAQTDSPGPPQPVPTADGHPVHTLPTITQVSGISDPVESPPSNPQPPAAATLPTTDSARPSLARLPEDSRHDSDVALEQTKDPDQAGVFEAVPGSAEPADADTGLPPAPTASMPVPGQQPEPGLTPVVPAVIDTGPENMLETETVDPALESPANASRTALSFSPHGPEWIQGRRSERFTIQIVAGVDQAALLRFAEQVSLDRDVAWFRTRRNDQHWYALVTGDYPDFATAQAAAARLPAPARRNQPWIRTFGSVQQDMQRS